jgi:hypothetical protein
MNEHLDPELLKNSALLSVILKKCFARSSLKILPVSIKY